MGAISNQNGVAPVQTLGQLEGDSKAAGLIEENLRLQKLRQGPNQGIEKGRIAQSLKLATAPGRCTPNQLMTTRSHGQHGEGSLRAQDLPGLISRSPPQAHLGRQTGLFIGMVPLANPLLSAGGGIGPIRCHHQIEDLPLAGGGWRA